MSQKGYYVSSVADSIFMNPMGMMQLKGLSSEVLYYQKISKPVRCQNGSDSSWKIQKCCRTLSAGSHELENRIQIQSLLDAVWETLRDEVAQSRGIAPATLDTLADDLLINNAEEALAQSIIDGLVYEDDFENKIKAALKIDSKEDLEGLDIGGERKDSRV